MRAKDFPQPFVASLVEQMQVDFTQGRQEAVGVGDRLWAAAVVDHFEAVVDQVDER